MNFDQQHNRTPTNEKKNMGSAKTLIMGAELTRTQVKDDPEELPLVPPGFESIPSFTLQMVHESVVTSPCNSDPRESIMDGSSTLIKKSKKLLRSRPSVDYSLFDCSSDEEPDYEQFEQGKPMQDKPRANSLPKGVFRGCADCETCQKVTARWHPEDSHRPNIDDAPVFYPTEEEFKDPIKYISSIRPRGEPYGICRIIPPLSWAPSCPLKEKGIWENSKFATRVQQVDKLQNRDTVKTNFSSHGVMMRKRRKVMEAGQESNPERFGFEPGPDFTLESFQKYADEFKKRYFGIEAMHSDLSSSNWQPSVEDMEGEYWRIVEKPTEQIEVLYGADLDTAAFGSGFPKDSSVPMNSQADDPCLRSGWNLNNLPRQPGSVLSFENGEISGVLVPWLYVGMCFSSFCWHVEDHHLYSLNYMHWGAPKVWYGVPGKDALKLEAAMKKHLADLFEEQPDLLHNLVTQFSPSTLKLEGVPVYRCIQQPGEFVLTFPRAYHSGFNCGFNCAEAVNVAPVDWLPQGQNAIELYREQSRKISISHDKLLLEAAREAVRAHWNVVFLKKSTLENLQWKDFCGPDGVLSKALKVRIEMEILRREYHSCSSQSRKMDADFNSNVERECFVCHYDLHLSAAGCLCSPDKFACLVHAKQLCNCDWSTRFFLFRYEISEMNLLFDALGGKLSAIHRWGISDLGLSLSSLVNKDKGSLSKPVIRTSLEGVKQINHGADSQAGQIGVRKSENLLQESKAHILQHSAGLKAGEKITFDANCPSMHQQNNIIAMPNPKQPDVHCHSSDKLAEGHRLQLGGHRDCSPTPIDDQKHEHSTRVAKLSDNASTEQKAINWSASSATENLTNFSNTVIKKTEQVSHCGDSVTSGKNCKHDVENRISLVAPKKEQLMENPEVLARPTKHDDVISFNCQKDRVLQKPETSTLQMDVKGNAFMSISQDHQEISSTRPAEGKEETGSCRGGIFNAYYHLSSGSASQNKSQSMKPIMISIMQQTSGSGSLSVKDTGAFMSKDTRDHLHASPLSRTGNSICESKDNRSDSGLKHNMVDRGDCSLASTSYAQRSVDRQIRLQKGPRMAKVVRRVNCNVEALEYGAILSGKLWSTSHVIYPKGYRSRVRYLSILDPVQMCYYISEILDAGLLGPLFMVTLEQCPSEVFIHVSANKCWDMVRERVNTEIRRLHNMGRTNLPSLQPPGSVDGIEMFGLSSPMIIQAIEAIDQNHVCIEYWKSRHQGPSRSLSTIPMDNNEVHQEEQRDHKSSLLGGADAALQGLLKRAKLDELQALCNILTNDKYESRREVVKIISDEVESRQQ